MKNFFFQKNVDFEVVISSRPKRVKYCECRIIGLLFINLIYCSSDLSCLFDGIECLIFPMTWQHTFIPALPRARTVFLEAPTPYLIGVLIESNQGRYIFLIEFIHLHIFL